MSDKNTELKSNMKDILKTVLVLVIIACVSGGLLGAINAVTYMTPEEILNQKLSKVYPAESIIDLSTTDKEEYKDLQSVLKEFNAKEKGEKSLVVFPVNKGKVDEGVVIYRVYGAGDYDCTLLVIVKNNKIDDVSVYASSATAGIGDKVYKDNHIKQYKGINLLEVTKPFEVAKKPSGDEFASVAGATKSSIAVNNAMNKVLELHKLLFGKGVD